MCTSKWWVAIGAVLGGLGVALGALGAHGLEDTLKANFTGPPKFVAGEELPPPAKYLRDWKTAAEYHMYHALAIVAVGLLAERRYSRSLAVAGTSFVIGILLFSGSLYVLVLTGRTILGAITPIGGVALLVGWTSLAIAAIPKTGCRPTDGEPVDAETAGTTSTAATSAVGTPAAAPPS